MPADALRGPRARRVALEAARAIGDEPLHEVLSWASHALDPNPGTIVWFGVDGGVADGDPQPVAPEPAEAIAERIAGLDLGRIDERVARTALDAAVETSRYWQEPDGDDVLAAAPAMRAALAPLLAAVLALPGSEWWRSPMEASQWLLAWDADAPQPVLGGDSLQRWRDATVQEESQAARDRPSEPEAMWSGTWWSIPPGEVSTRAVGGVPVHLDLVEDPLDWDAATAFPIARRGSVLELDEDALVALCRAHPLDVTASRRHDWFRATGRHGAWAIPDWHAVAAEHAGVHVSVGAWLDLAGRAVEVGDGTATVLAGWSPDATCWLRAPSFDGEAVGWRRHDDGSTWHRSPEAAHDR